MKMSCEICGKFFKSSRGFKTCGSSECKKQLKIRTEKTPKPCLCGRMGYRKKPNGWACKRCDDIEIANANIIHTGKNSTGNNVLHEWDFGRLTFKLRE